MGVRSSQLVAGYSHLHRELEVELAGLKGTQECLLFPTGGWPLQSARQRVSECRIRSVRAQAARGLRWRVPR
jgi:hypothetical protein